MVPRKFISHNYTFRVAENSRCVNNVDHKVEQKPHYCNSGESIIQKDTQPEHKPTLDVTLRGLVLNLEKIYLMLKLCVRHHKEDMDSCEMEYHAQEATYHLQQLLKSLQEVSIEINACCNHLQHMLHEVSAHGRD